MRSWGCSTRQKHSCLINGSLLSFFTPSTRWGHIEETATYEPGGPFSPDTKYADTLTLDVPASRTVKNECLIFISHPGCGSLSEHPDLAKTPYCSELLIIPQQVNWIGPRPFSHTSLFLCIFCPFAFIVVFHLFLFFSISEGLSFSFIMSSEYDSKLPFLSTRVRTDLSSKWTFFCSYWP